MLETIIRTANKFLIVSFFSYYIFAKALNIYVEKKKWLLIFLLSVVFSAVYVIMRLYIPAFSILIYVLALFTANKLLFKLPLMTTAVGSSISFGIAFCLDTVCMFLTIPYMMLMYGVAEQNVNGVNVYFLLGDFVCDCVYVIICMLMFKIKRFRNGFTFLKKDNPNTLGILVALIVPLIATYFNIATDKENILFLIPIVYVALSGLIIIFWALLCVKQDYIGNVRTRDIEILHSTVTDLQEQLDSYKENNEKLSKIIHRDNKEIPALELLVKKAITSIKNDEPDITELVKLENDLRTLADERKNIVIEAEKNNDILQKTCSVLLNSTIMFMYNKATLENVDFHISVCDFSLTKNIEYDLNTILADLLENAIIACNSVDDKKIKISFFNENEILKICVFDSGKAFEPNFFNYLGVFRYTSRKSSGGSGIGIMSTVELCKKHYASFTINEIVTDGFTKCVSVTFDGKSEIRVSSPRNLVNEICTSRGDIVIGHN